VPVDVDAEFVVPPAFMPAECVVLVEPVVVDVSVFEAQDVMSAAPARSAIVEIIDRFIGNRVVRLTSGRLSSSTGTCKQNLLAD
jgi:hypothetical protein